MTEQQPAVTDKMIAVIEILVAHNYSTTRTHGAADGGVVILFSNGDRRAVVGRTIVILYRKKAGPSQARAFKTGDVLKIAEALG